MSGAWRDPAGSLENGAVIVGVGLARHQLKTQFPISVRSGPGGASSPWTGTVARCCSVRARSAPYTDGVSWLILRQHRAVTDAVVDGFEKLFPKGNARKLQPLNNRTVRYRRQR
jgi:hypothetical protein